MISYEASQVLEVLLEIEKIESPKMKGTFVCPECNHDGLNEDALWLHFQYYHVNERNKLTTCPICAVQITKKPFPVHLFNDHGFENKFFFFF